MWSRILLIVLHTSCSMSYVISPATNTTLGTTHEDMLFETEINDRRLDLRTHVSSKHPETQGKNASTLTARNEALQARTQVIHPSCSGMYSAQLQQILVEVGRWSRLAMRANDINRNNEVDAELLRIYFMGRRGYITENEHRIIFNHYTHLHAEIRGRPMNRNHREVEISCDKYDPLCNQPRGIPLALHQNQGYTHMNVCPSFWNLPRSNPRHNRRLGNYDQIQYMLGVLTQCRSVYHWPTQLDAPNTIDDTRRYRNFAKELSVHYGREDPPAYGIAFAW